MSTEEISIPIRLMKFISDLDFEYSEKLKCNLLHITHNNNCVITSIKCKNIISVTWLRKNSYEMLCTDGESKRFKILICLYHPMVKKIEEIIEKQEQNKE